VSSGVQVPDDALRWGAQTMWWSERYRCRPLVWPAGDTWFCNDPLGPKPHTHPDASEIFLVARGTMSLIVGKERHRMNPGDFCLVPPDTYHEPMNAGDDDLCVLALVAPNWRDRRWKPDGFDDPDLRGTAQLGSVADAGPLPSDAVLRSEIIRLAPGEGRDGTTSGADRLVYALTGTIGVHVEHLQGSLRPHQFVNVIAGADHVVSNAGKQDGTFLSVYAHDPAAAG
jgi:mannose-6-phosphate isomerase-like protein (cupin superfamily)